LQVHVNTLASNPEPAVPIGKSVSSDFLICLDGARGGDT
jgi:predicted transcriptional regulator